MKTATGSKPTCTPGPVPSLDADARAKRVEPVPGKTVIYVVRHRWGDAMNVVRLDMDGRAMGSTVPASFVRLVAAPGTHQLSFEWAKGRGSLEVRGEAGQVVFVDLVGSLWVWNEWYRLQPGDRPSRDRILKSRLVADVSMDDQE